LSSPALQHWARKGKKMPEKEQKAILRVGKWRRADVNAAPSML